MQLKLLATGINTDTEHASCIYSSCSFQSCCIHIQFRITIYVYAVYIYNLECIVVRPWYCSYTTVIQKNLRDILAPDSLTNTAVTRSVINDEQGVALLIRPLCLKQPGCGFAARCRLSHFAYHRRDFQLFVG